MTNEITINGLTYPVKFTYSALMELEKTLNMPFSEIAELMGNGGISAMVHIAYVGLKHGGRIAKKELTLTLEEVGDLMTPELIEQFANLFADSFAPADESKKEVPKGDKKK